VNDCFWIVHPLVHLTERSLHIQVGGRSERDTIQQRVERVRIFLLIFGRRCLFVHITGGDTRVQTYPIITVWNGDQCASGGVDLPLRNLVTDQELLARIRRGDEQAFDTLFRQFYGPLVGLAESLLKTRAVAEEVVQDVMLEVWRRRESIHLEESWRAYLFRSARNRALNELRHASVEKRGEPWARGEESVGASALSGLVNAELDAAIVAAVSALPEPVRDVFTLSRTNGLKYSEIAQVLGVSVKTVEARMTRALKELRVQLAAWLPESGR
jgi:RNA polymerase sigma-70 factor, ECF subfamily